ncbi:MAG TPA: molybdopterin cofactor-binding domain-containing protein, partial [Bacillota bacterium]
EGQIIGGIAQGIGNSLFERISYDEGGQLTTASFMDYLLPSAPEVPDTEVYHLETPSPLNPYGFKGAGESGVMTVPAAIVQAIEDALGPGCPAIEKVPLLPEDVRNLAAQAAAGPRQAGADA